VIVDSALAAEVGGMARGRSEVGLGFSTRSTHGEDKATGPREVVATDDGRWRWRHHVVGGTLMVTGAMACTRVAEHRDERSKAKLGHRARPT
jgi:hypothetical protein